MNVSNFTRATLVVILKLFFNTLQKRQTRAVHAHAYTRTNMYTFTHAHTHARPDTPPYTPAHTNTLQFNIDILKGITHKIVVACGGRKKEKNVNRVKIHYSPTTVAV